MKNTKVLIVDDSAVVRQVLSAGLAEHTGIEVIGAAADPLFAMDKMQRNWPDVIVLDVGVPPQGGHALREKLIGRSPPPGVFWDTQTGAGAAPPREAR
ncbi:response regulator, partial [Bowmanella yangjiangensis]